MNNKRPDINQFFLLLSLSIFLYRIQYKIYDCQTYYGHTNNFDFAIYLAHLAILSSPKSDNFVIDAIIQMANPSSTFNSKLKMEIPLPDKTGKAETGKGVSRKVETRKSVTVRPETRKAETGKADFNKILIMPIIHHANQP